MSIPPYTKYPAKVENREQSESFTVIVAGCSSTGSRYMGRSMFSINLRFLGVFALAAVVAISIANVSGPSADADISIDVVPEGQYDLYAEVIIDSGAGPEEIHFFASVDLVDRTVGVGVGCDGFQFASPGGIFGASGHKPGFATTTAWNLGLPSS